MAFILVSKQPFSASRQVFNPNFVQSSDLSVFIHVSFMKFITIFVCITRFYPTWPFFFWNYLTRIRPAIFPPDTTLWNRILEVENTSFLVQFKSPNHIRRGTMYHHIDFSCNPPPNRLPQVLGLTKSVCSWQNTILKQGTDPWALFVEMQAILRKSSPVKRTRVIVNIWLTFRQTVSMVSGEGKSLNLSGF